MNRRVETAGNQTGYQTAIGCQHLVCADHREEASQQHYDRRAHPGQRRRQDEIARGRSQTSAQPVVVPVQAEEIGWLGTIGVARPKRIPEGFGNTGWGRKLREGRQPRSRSTKPSRRAVTNDTVDDCRDNHSIAHLCDHLTRGRGSTLADCLLRFETGSAVKRQEAALSGVLEGVRVLDFGRYIAGPFCAALLGDLGAEVIRIERLAGGEDRPFIPVGAGPEVGGAMFLAMNRNKLGMTLDPAVPKGREIVKKLVATADVVVANLPPQVLRALALDLDSLRLVKPDIILTTVTGFGAGGPLSHKHGFDGIGQAMSGAVYLSGPPGQPIMMKVPWVDFGTAFLSAFGTLAALLERGKSGRGQKVEGALLRTAVAISNSVLIEQALTQVNRTAIVNRAFNTSPGDIYQTRDGWIVTTVIGPAMFRRWCRMIGEEHWLADPHFRDDQARADHGEVVSARMSKWCAERSCVEALSALEEANIVAGQVYSPQQALDDPHIRAARLLEEVTYPGLGATLPLAPTPIELSETPGTYRRPAPLLGEHTDEILASLGYDATEIAALRREQVV